MRILHAEATLLFDRGLTEIFIMEDVAVLLTLLVETISKMLCLRVFWLLGLFHYRHINTDMRLIFALTEI